jgi:hypothetical protein
MTIYGVEDMFTTLAVLPPARTRLRDGQQILSVLPPPPALSGVRFDNETIMSPDVGTALFVDYQSVPDSAVATVSFFFRTDNATAQYLMLLGDSSGNDFNAIELIDAGTVNGAPVARIEMFFTNSTGSPYCEFDFVETPVVANQYVHVFMSVDLNHPAGSKIGNLVVNGQVQTQNIPASSDGSPAFMMGLNNAQFGLPQTTDTLPFSGKAYILDFQEVWVGLGQYVDPSNVGLFRAPDGTPMDLGPDGSTPTGTAPTYYFKGNAASFPNNLGSGEQPHILGFLTDAP